MRASSGIKDFIESLKQNGELLTLSTPLSPKFEISTVISEFGKKEAPALLFEKVKGYPFPVVGNLLGTKKRLSMALGVNQENFFENALSKLEKRIPPVLLKDRTPKEVILQKGKNDLLKFLPILTHYAGDSGPYITSGITSARDPKDGNIGRGLHRMEVRGKNELGISLINPPLSEIYAQYKKENRRMEVATVIGVDPAILIGSISKIPRGVDKLSVAGGLKGKPIPTVKAETVDIDIPAHAEIVIEGFIDPKGKEKDGTLGESSGYYMTFSKSPTIHVMAITYRKEAIYQTIVPWSLEVDNLLYLVHGLDFVPKMTREIPSLKQIHLIPGTFGSHVVMSIVTDHKGEVRRALSLALSFPNIKKAIIVDEDVDPEDNQEVEWALATRFQGDRDLIVLPDLRGQPIDPSSKEGFLTTKIGMDATRPKREGFERVDVPKEAKSRLASILKDLKEKEKK
ncbi:MAG TPA: UbiD family decarboxylase [Thermodesulfobacteriota bacterium]|nr:UbiD family decarboxylase [Thermodesulfobacteriota bacterium]